MVTGVINSDNSITVNWDAVDNADSYLIHYGDANIADPHDAKYMGYSEATSWTLATVDLPTLVTGDKIYFYVQAYNVKVDDKTAPTAVEKARYLHDGPFTGSAWSTPVTLTAK